MKLFANKKFNIIFSIIVICIYAYAFVKDCFLTSSDGEFLIFQNLVTFLLFFFLFEHGIAGRYKEIKYHKFSEIKLFLGLAALIGLIFIEASRDTKNLLYTISSSLIFAGQYGIVQNNKLE